MWQTVSTLTDDDKHTDNVRQSATVCDSATSKKDKHTNTPTLTPNPDTGREDRLCCHCED